MRTTLGLRGRLLALGTGISIVLLSVVLVGVASSSPADRVAVRAALDDVFGAGTFRAADVNGKGMPDQAVAAARNDIEARLSSHMTGAALEHWRQALGEAVTTESDGKHIVGVGGGVDQIKFDSDAQDGHVTGYAHTWSQGVTPGSGETGHPEQWIRFDCHVVQGPDGWRVDELHYVPGLFDENGNWTEAGG